MITQSESGFSIPDDWPQAVRLFWDLEEAGSISPSQWDSILDWLFTTKFDERSFVAGQQAARLIQRKAPQAVKDRLAERADHATIEQTKLCQIALE